MTSQLNKLDNVLKHYRLLALALVIVNFTVAFGLAQPPANRLALLNFTLGLIMAFAWPVHEIIKERRYRRLVAVHGAGTPAQ